MSVYSPELDDNGDTPPSQKTHKSTIHRKQCTRWLTRTMGCGSSGEGVSPQVFVKASEGSPVQERWRWCHGDRHRFPHRRWIFSRTTDFLGGRTDLESIPRGRSLFLLTVASPSPPRPYSSLAPPLSSSQQLVPSTIGS